MARIGFRIYCKEGKTSEMKDDCGYFHGYGQTRDKSVPLFDPSIRKPQGDRSDAYKGKNQDKDKE